MRCSLASNQSSLYGRIGYRLIINLHKWVGCCRGRNLAQVMERGLDDGEEQRKEETILGLARRPIGCMAGPVGAMTL